MPPYPPSESARDHLCNFLPLPSRANPAFVPSLQPSVPAGRGAPLQPSGGQKRGAARNGTLEGSSETAPPRDVCFNRVCSTRRVRRAFPPRPALMPIRSRGDRHRKGQLRLRLDGTGTAEDPRHRPPRARWPSEQAHCVSSMNPPRRVLVQTRTHAKTAPRSSSQSPHLFSSNHSHQINFPLSPPNRCVVSVMTRNRPMPDEEALGPSLGAQTPRTLNRRPPPPAAPVVSSPLGSDGSH